MDERERELNHRLVKREPKVRWVKRVDSLVKSLSKREVSDRSRAENRIIQLGVSQEREVMQSTDRRR
jgi:hypothetical protein